MKPHWGDSEPYTLVGEIHDPQADYSFSDVIVVKDKADGKLYAAHDSGCSCPTPFEDTMYPTDCTEVRNADDLRAFIKAEEYTHYNPTDVDNLVALVFPSTRTEE